MTSSGITRLTLTDFNHTLLGEKHIRAYQWNRNNFAFESTAPSSAIGNFKYTIQGYRDAHLVVHTHRYIRTIPALESYAQVAHYKPFEWDFKPNPAVGIYDVSTVAGTGWQYNPTENCLMIGNGTEYANDVNSKASIFVKIPEDLNAKLFVSAKFDTEDKFDFLFIGYLNKDGERVLLKEATGTGEIKEEFKLENVGPTAEVFLEFSSDQAVVATGVKVTKVKIY